MASGKLIRYGLPFSNVVATGVATCQVTPGRTLEKLTLKLGGTTFTKAMIDRIRIKANGKTIFEGSGSQVDAINKYRGVATDASYLDIDFTDLEMLSEFDRVVSAFDTSVGIGNITVEVSITGATAPTLVAILTESASQKAKDGSYAPYAGLMRKLLAYPFSMPNGGRLPMNVPFGPQNGSLIERVHVFHTGHMTGATVKQDGLVLHESLRLENEYMQKIQARVPQANVYSLDFVPDGNISKALDTRSARSLEWLFDFDAADNGTVLIEYLDTLGNL